MSSDVMLRTGEAARRLGVSRQHIVDLCNQGKMRYVFVGTHRRIPESAISAQLAVRPPRGDHRLSRWLHAAIISYLVMDPESVIAKARNNIARGRRSAAIDEHAEPYARQWEAIFDTGVPAIIAALTGTTERDDDLRSSTPFAGVLPRREVTAIKAAYCAWRDQQPADP